jgi:hypothetical protein
VPHQVLLTLPCLSSIDICSNATAPRPAVHHRCLRHVPHNYLPSTDARHCHKARIYRLGPHGGGASSLPHLSAEMEVRHYPNIIQLYRAEVEVHEGGGGKSPQGGRTPSLDLRSHAGAGRKFQPRNFTSQPRNKKSGLSFTGSRWRCSYSDRSDGM